MFGFKAAGRWEWHFLRRFTTLLQFPQGMSYKIFVVFFIIDWTWFLTVVALYRLAGVGVWRTIVVHGRVDAALGRLSNINKVSIN